MSGGTCVPVRLKNCDRTLFLGNDDIIAAVQGVTPLMEASDAAWEALFTDMQEAFARRGISLVHLIAPDKHTVLPEALPRWLNPADRSRVSRVVSRLQSEILPPPVDLVRLFDAHRKAGALSPLYHPTDTHWTEYGAALAVDAALTSVLDADISSVPYAVSMVAEHGGDLARMLGLQGSVNTMAPKIRRPDRLSCATPNGTSVAIVSLDPLPTRRFTCRNPDAPTKHALVYMDSFGMAAVPRLVQLFQQVDFIWSDVVDMAEVDRIAPEIAIRIMVARKLQTVDAATLFRTTQ